MAAPKQNSTLSPDTPITVKITVNDAVKKLKLPLRDLGVNVLPAKLRSVLDIKPDQHLLLERYSDSVGGYIILDEGNPQVFKTLIRAAKAKLKLRLKATVTPAQPVVKEEKPSVEPPMTQTTMDTYMNTSRNSTALDRRSIGSGIFQFREARASQQSLVNNDGVPVPRPFYTTASFPTLKDSLTLRPREKTQPAEPVEPVAKIEVAKPIQPVQPAYNTPAWSVYCNVCDSPMLNTHFHCSICDDGDYDLCEKCVTAGKMCPGEGHWLIKRTISDGKVINATTERILSTKEKDVPTPAVPEPTIPVKEMPGSFETSPLIKDIVPTVISTPSRTCNSCVVVLPEHEFITCTTCEDFDLCVKCHTDNKHGHHPAHGFRAATDRTVLPLAAKSKLAPGRNVRHSALCDGCNKKIYGVRHKCLTCPDWDYCNDCMKGARTAHPRHRFAALYDPIPEPVASSVVHYGVYCDGPLCSGQANNTYIQGVRYKCTICHDTDFCANCEAMPSNHHNHTHPLLKLKTPVLNINVSTDHSDASGNVRSLGDRRPESAAVETRSASTETVPMTQAANAATQVQTVAEIKPTEVKSAETTLVDVKPLEAQMMEVKQPSPPVVIPVKKFVAGTVPYVNAIQLNAHFVHDSIPDGFVCEPEARFTQVWTLKNPGPYNWPAGCSVRFVGGDNMFDVDNNHPASVQDLEQATESNVTAREVAVGEEVAFKVTMKAGKREGKSISYWRLKAADGTPFGHRLWCDIQVKKSETEPFSFTTARSMMPPIPTLPAMMQYSGPNYAPQMEHMRALQRQGLPSAHPRAQCAYGLDPHFMQQQQMMWSRYHPQREKSRPVSKQQVVKQREVFNQRAATLQACISATRAQRDELQRSAEVVAEAEAEAAAAAAAASAIAAETAKAADVEQTADEVDEKEEELKGSNMVFPKLDKESPCSSAYASVTSHGKAAYVENDEGVVEQTATQVAAPASTVADEEDFESVDNEIDVLSATGEESDEDDGFLTDDEYDILNASDDETVASMK